MANTKTLAIKARLANHIRKTLYNKKNLEQFNQAEKVDFFNDVWAKYLDMHSELNDYKAKRKAKAEIQRLRKERGYKAKKKSPNPNFKKEEHFNRLGK